MNNGTSNSFVNLNRDSRWPGFEQQGLELRPDGALQLHSLPLLGGDLPEAVTEAAEPGGPAGIAVSPDGTIFFSDPAGNRVMRVDPCDGTTGPVACVGGEGDTPGRFKAPRGLVIPAHRRSLFVADSGNDRVQGFDLGSSRLVDIWAQSGGDLDAPWAVAGDGGGNVYVVDYGNQRVVKFNRVGDPVPIFWETVRNANLLRKPSDIAVYPQGETAHVFIVDENSPSVFVFDDKGNPIFGDGFGSGELYRPMGIAVTEDAVYIGDNARRRVLAFARGGDYQFIGEAVGYQGPVASLGLDGKAGLLVHTGVSVASQPICRSGLLVNALAPLEPVRLQLGKGYRERGVLWTDEPIEVRDFEVKWHRLKAEAERIGSDARLRLYVHASDDASDAPTVDAQKNDPFEDVRWQPRPGAIDQFAGVDDLFIGGEARYLWVGVLFSGDGRGTPLVSQMRVEFDHDTYLAHLPAIYRGDTACGDFLLRFLSLFETFFSQVEGSIELLSVLFDPVAVPKEYLPWLAGWLALQLDEDWSEQQQRQAIRAAFESYGRRGTPEGLREALRLFAGVDALIEEPLQNAGWWSVPGVAGSCGCKQKSSAERVWEGVEGSILGFTTMLASVSVQGAVLGSTATLDGSHLITGEQFGAPLFEDTAHQFSVQVYRGQLKCQEDLAEVREVIDREKPAHTSYHLCVIEPRMRVGFQSRVGIDTVVAGPPEAMALGEGVVLGEAAALGGEPPGRLGMQSRVGATTRVG